MAHFYHEIEKVFGCNLSPELIDAADSAEDSKFMQLDVAWEEFYSNQVTEMVKPAGHVRPYFPNFFIDSAEWTFGGLGLDFHHFTELDTVWEAIDALKLRLFYCHSVAMDDPAGPILDQLSTYYDSPGFEIDFNRSKKRFVNYLTFLYNIKSLLDSEVVIFLPYKHTLNTKHQGNGEIINFYHYLKTENWDFADVIHIAELKTGMRFSDEHKQALCFVARDKIERISAMSNHINGQIDYYFAYSFWSNVLEKMVTQRLKSINEYSGNVYDLVHLSYLTKVAIPNLENLTPQDIISIRSNDDAFESWRINLGMALREIQRLNVEGADWQRDANRLLKDYTYEGKRKLEEDLKKSRFLNVAQTNAKIFTFGAMGSLGAALITHDLLSSLVASSITTTLTILQELMAGKNAKRALHQHYLAIS